jgi:DNA polymerase-1
MNTYIKAYKDDVQKGRVHSFHSLNTTRTGRPSSDSPNFYNIPKREEEAMELIRGGLVPTEGYEIVSADYKQIEISIQACNSLDEAMLEYCRNPKANMHLDEAKAIFMLPEEEAIPFRQDTKNAAVFPELYGDWYESIAREFWKRLQGKTTTSGISILKHLRKKGIRDQQDFEAHMKVWERKFWRKYQATADWRDDQVLDYKKKLYVESLSGWRRNGLIFRNEICNTPVQNAAFTCLLWSLIEVNKLRKREKWKTGIIGQIYDQIIFDVHPDEKKHVLKKVEDIMCHKIRERFPWIIVPLRVDWESSGINASWAVKAEEEKE